MSSTLEAATQDRKARLAKLKSLKRKQPEPSEDNDNSLYPPQDEDPSEEIDISRTVLSGRNYDPETRGPKLGFEYAPNANKKTLEEEAAALEEATRKATLEERAEDDGKPLEMDIFKLQPKKPNWDLKRDLKERTQILEVRTNNAIARMVREKFEAKKKESGSDGEEVAGLKGKDLVDAVHMREREEEDEAQREREEDREMMEAA
jgi:coiled-coil domain-containing protein 12